MLRRLHSLPGLVAGLLVMFMALSGAFLSLQPAIAQWQAAHETGQPMTTAALASTVAGELHGVSRIVKMASGAVVAYVNGLNGQTATRIDPISGTIIGPYDTSPIFAFMTELHRSLFLGQQGHIVAGIAAIAMLALSVSGLFLVVARLGGWSKVFSTAKGPLRQRLHVDIGRIVLVALLLSGLTGAYMSLVSLGLVSTGSNGFTAFPAANGGTPAPIAELAALQATPLGDLRELVFPATGDPTDVFTLTTNGGQGFVDQASGDLLNFVPNSFGQTVYEAFYTLHTGQGIWWLGLVLGLAALGVPVMAVSGTLIWLMRRRNQPRLKDNATVDTADVVILVGSEGNATWGFAASLHAALSRSGHRVHTAPMNAISRHYRLATRLFILTATYGDGAAPQNASRFLSRLDTIAPRPDLPVAILGFGDRSFANFCQFASDVEAAMAGKGWIIAQPMGTIDRQSSQAFAQWGVETGLRMGTPLDLQHVAQSPKTRRLELLDRDDYGVEVQAPTSVLRFVLPAANVHPLRTLFGFTPRLPHFEVGDLVGILPPGSNVPRYYSLASATRDGVVEICVRKQVQGLCSEYLHSLIPGDGINMFITPNAAFRPTRLRAPVIMIGAGTGLAPLAGFIRHNYGHRPYHLYFGGRDPRSDALYAEQIAACLDDRRLASFNPSFSRVVGGGYVQDGLRDDSETIRSLIARGAQIMVCGGREMAAGVRQAIDEIVQPLGETAHHLKTKGRYLEDVY